MMSMQVHKEGGLVAGTLDGLSSAERETTQLQPQLECRLWMRRWIICQLIKS